ncbi:MAG: acetyltransferase [Candidatus Gastranaerophilaceae bacterium]
MKEEIILFGLTQTADIVQYYLDKYSNYKVVARCVDKEYLNCNEYKDMKVVAFEEIEKHFSPSKYKMAIPMMNTHLNKVREKKYNIAKEKGYKFITFINKTSTVETDNIGENVFILGQNHIQPFVKIGNNCMIWSGTEIGHHTVIEDNCFITGGRIAGRITIKKNCFIGHSSAIRDGVTIGAYSVIGMSSIIHKNIPDYTVTSTKQTKKWEQKSIDLEELF